jgi:hypothetical protein
MPDATSHDAAEPLRMPEHDNPLAWRAKAKEGRRGAILLLEALTEDEVARYLEMAGDQVRNEERRLWLQLTVGAGAVALLAYDAADGLANGVTSWHVAVLAVALAMAYWPWRARACRRLWMGHVDAAKAELARRRAAT